MADDRLDTPTVAAPLPPPPPPPSDPPTATSTATSTSTAIAGSDPILTLRAKYISRQPIIQIHLTIRIVLSVLAVIIVSISSLLPKVEVFTIFAIIIASLAFSWTVTCIIQTLCNRRAVSILAAEGLLPYPRTSPKMEILGHVIFFVLNSINLVICTGTWLRGRWIPPPRP
ncbi:hypothetical protein TWF730_006930 [Orbilia blumenaviensis]|uniref:Uncharacterized protein n=1 Tax=Orbilia blumenaviensis TaxID=1796055 RepID=A0AAV9VGY7_9PEZI